MISRASTYLYQRPKLVLALLLGPPMLYFLVVYLGSLFALLINSFFYLEEFTGLVVREFTLRPGDRAWLAANETLCAVGTGAFDYSGFVPYKP